MGQAYDKSSIEVKAKELLLPMQVACPDTMWQELSYQLNEQNVRSENKWTNKLYTPKALAVVLLGIGVIIVAGWKFSGSIGKGFAKTNATSSLQNPQPTPPANNNFLAAKPPAKPSVDTTHVAKANVPAKDTVKPVAPPITNTNVVQPPNANTKIDTAAQRRYYIRLLAYRKKRDSLAAVARYNIARADSAKRFARHVAHDSVATRMRSDSAGN